MIQSSAPLFKAALKARLEGIQTLSSFGTLISRGHPYPKAWSGDLVIIGRVSNRRRTWVASMTQCNEEYDVEVLVNAAGSAQDPYAGFEERAYAMADAIEESLIAWTRESGGQLVSGTWGHVMTAIPGVSEDQEGIDDDQRGAPRARDATVSLTVHVTARLVDHG
jgi:hypothetical protein